MNSSLRNLLLTTALYLPAIPAAATTITVGDVAPALGSGDNNVAGSVTIGGTPAGTGTVTVDGGSNLTSTGLNMATGTGSSATLNVQSAGTVQVNSNFVGLAANTGTSNTNTATINVSGAGSSFTLTGSSATFAASLRLGRQGTGEINVTDGGLFQVQGTNDMPSPGLNLGDIRVIDGSVVGHGEVNVDGAGSKLTVSGNTGFINVGRSGVNSSGTFNVTNGGVVEGVGTNGLVSFNVGLGDNGVDVGATGTALIDGAGSRISLAGRNVASGSNGGAFASVGLNAGTTGTLTVSNGGQLLIDATGSGAVTAPGLQAGTNGASGVRPAANGTVNISGTGSKIVVTSDGANPFVGIGRAGQGNLNVTAGGILELNGTGASPGTNFTSINIGGSTTLTGGTGTALVSGAGSEVRLLGTDSVVHVGFGGTGTLNVTAGGKLASDLLLVGSTSGVAAGIGTANVNASELVLHSNASAGGGIGVGRGAGSTGTVNLSNGATVSITFTGDDGGFTLGGSPTTVGGTGVLNISGAGTALSVEGTNNLGVVGRSGVGVMTVTGGAAVDMAANGSTGARVLVGATAAGVGTLTVSGGSSLNAGSLLGIGHDGASDTGIGTVTVNNSTITATTIQIGATGTLSGSGTVVGNVINGGTINPGNSPGRLRIMGDYSNVGGTIVLEVEADGLGGYLTDVIVFDVGASIDLGDAAIVFSFLGDTNPDDFLADGGFDLDSFFKQSAVGDDDPALDNELTEVAALLETATFEAEAESYIFDSFAFDPTQGATFEVTPTASVPEPATLLLLGFGLAGLIAAGRRSRARAA